MKVCILLEKYDSGQIKNIHNIYSQGSWLTNWANNKTSLITPTSEAEELPGFGLTGEVAGKVKSSFRYPPQILSDQHMSKTRG